MRFCPFLSSGDVFFGEERDGTASEALKADQYITILEQGLLVKLKDEEKGGKNVVWVHDNASNHTARIVKRWMSDHKIKCMDWPPKSPDQNPAENIWHYLDLRIRNSRHPPQNADELWRALEREWYKIPLETIRKHYDSIPRRVQALKMAKGKWTKY